MELEAFVKLYNRIQLEPSILLLGQSYCLMGGEKDPVWNRLVTEAYPELDLPRKRVDYPTFWQGAVKTPGDVELVMARIAEAGNSVQKNPAVSAVSKLRWSLLFTSAIDDPEMMATEKGYTLVQPEERNAKAMYLNKERRFRVNLCGSREAPPPVLKDRIDRKKFDMQITNRIRWISNTYLEYYGVLVIDGFIPEYDWLNDENLFGQLIEMPPRSVYWFSAPESLEENAAMLVERGILVTEEDSLYEHLLRHIPELMEDKEPDVPEEDNVLYTSLTLRLSDRQTHTVRIRRSDISDITGSNLCVIDDDIMRGEALSAKSPAEKFADFLMQDGLPSWHLFNTKVNERLFYIARDKDAELEKRLFQALKETGVARKPVILCGPSNSGKSMMLAQLAWSIANRRKYPVIFIRGELVVGAEKRLDKFISNWFGDIDRFGGERPEKVVVIWDGSGLKRTEQDYENLQRLLFNRNAQVVGSVYSSTREKAITLSQDLSRDEEQRMRGILASLGRSYMDRFDEIRSSRKAVDMLKNSSLLYLLQALFKYEFDGEYRELARILAHQFNQEKQRAEQDTSHSLQKYVEDFFRAQRARAQCGVASSFQEQLQLILARMAVKEQDEAIARQEPVSDDKKQELEKYRQLSQCITTLNNVLAVASEFGVQLPLHLLLSFLRTEGGNSYVPYIEESAVKIIEILRTDTLLDFCVKSHPLLGEEYYVNFRNTIEAENYICLLCDLPLEDHSPKRKKKEIEIFKQLVGYAETEVDIRSVIELGRQFGPNGHGMLSEFENMRRCSDYLEYKDYWLDIAKTMIEKFPDYPETILLYAHLTREYVSWEEPEHRAYYEDDFIKARTMLQTALERLDGSTAQYDRLSVELCANYQQTLRERFDPVIYSDIRKRVRTAFRRSKQRDTAELRRDFSSNYMLDILLNAYSEFVKSDAAPEVKEQGLLDICYDIDDMLNLDSLIYEKKNQDLIRKIREVYSQLDSESTRMDQLEKKLIGVNSDAFLYLQALMIWQKDTDALENCDCGQDVAFLFANRYMWVCRDIPYSRLEMSKELRERLTEQTRRDAQQVVAFLTEQDELVRWTQSERCVEMLMRAKWLLKTGNPMLEEKQCVPLSWEEWQDINELCNRYHNYHQYHKDTEPFIPAYFLKGVYEWIYGDAKQAIDWFNEAKSYARGDNSVRSIERLVLCKEGTTEPRTFAVSVQQGENKKYTARIFKETTPQSAASDDRVATRYGLGVAPPVVKYLFDGAVPKEQNQRAQKDGIVRFNLIGAQVGLPQGGGMSNGQ